MLKLAEAFPFLKDLFIYLFIFHKDYFTGLIPVCICTPSYQQNTILTMSANTMIWPGLLNVLCTLYYQLTFSWQKSEVAWHHMKVKIPIYHHELSVDQVLIMEETHQLCVKNSSQSVLYREGNHRIQWTFSVTTLLMLYKYFFTSHNLQPIRNKVHSF